MKINQIVLKMKFQVSDSALGCFPVSQKVYSYDICVSMPGTTFIGVVM